MDLNTVLSKSPDAASRTYDGQATIVLPSRAEVKVLNEIGSKVWNAIDGRRTLAQILEALLEEYDIPREQVERDVLDFVGELRTQGMVS
jgi:Coenzyme PQQ synthesis protein D (PqqD)